MNTDTVILVLLGGLVLGVVAVVCSPRFVRWDLAGDARLTGLPLREDLRPWLARRRRADAVVQAVGGCSGAAAAVWALVTRPGTFPDFPFVLPLVVAVGAAIGRASPRSSQRLSARTSPDERGTRASPVCAR